MKPSNLLCRQLAARAAAEGGGAPLVLVACGPDGAPEPLRTWDDATGEPVLWGVHCVNEEPGGRIVDYAQGLVFDDRRQLVAALFENARVLVEQEDLDW
ncbi:hypothetical protein BE20_37580 [Sorangium cellulosum]|nr:hypothetical protein BE20_37580 [Sorangium cellulosum]